MKLPIPLLLYLVSLGLLGLAGWTVYQVLPAWKSKAREEATQRGYTEGLDRLTRGRGQGPQNVDWRYGESSKPWWETLQKANLTGKLPPPPPVAKDPELEKPEVKLDVRPLDEIIELVSLVYDGKDGGKSANSHVVVRFKENANVEPPEWWERENAPPTPGGAAAPAAAATRGDVTPNTRAGGRPAPPPSAKAIPGARTTTTPPMSTAGRVYLQKLWVQDEGDPRRSAELWPVKPREGATLGKIRLVKVASDAQSAWFVRELPPPREGEPAPPPKEEELLKSAANLSQDVLRELLRLQGRGGPVAPRAVAAPTAVGQWMDVPETTRIGNVVNIGRDDEKRFRDNDDFFDQVYVDTYVSRDGSMRGLIVKNVDAEIGRKFGVSAGEVLIEVNGKKVESRGQAIQAGKKDYQRGVRTFVTKWLVNGAVIERTIQAPDR